LGRQNNQTDSRVIPKTKIKEAIAAAIRQAGGSQCTKGGAQFTGRVGAVGGVDTGGTGDVSSSDYKKSHNAKTPHGGQSRFCLLITT
jgi:hypothetical protein